MTATRVGAAPVITARARRGATLLLVVITAVWGSTFFLIRDVVRVLSPADFLAVRFTIAAVAMTVVFWRPMLALTRRELTIGVGLGIVYAVAQILQTVGLAHTEASRSGFITGTYVVLTPSSPPSCCASASRGPPGLPCSWPQPGWQCCPASASVTASVSARR